MNSSDLPGDLVSRLAALLPEKGRVGVLFSGGRDSSVLLALLVRAKGRAGVSVLHARNTLSEGWEEAAARRCAALLGTEMVSFDFDPLSLPEVAENGPLRCFHCKDALCRKALELCGERGITVLADGTNASDDPADRPGSAALRRHGVLSPLAELGLDARAVTELGRLLGLPLPQAPGSCMATRIPAGTPLDAELLSRLRRLEQLVRAEGFPLVRARLRDGRVMLETSPSEVGRLLRLVPALERAAEKLNLGILGVNLDGYRGNERT